MTEFLASGFQIHNRTPVPQSRGNRPKWARTRKSIEGHIWQRYGSLRAKVAYRYWVLGHTAPRVAKDLREKLSTVESIVKRLSRRSE